MLLSNALSIYFQPLTLQVRQKEYGLNDIAFLYIRIVMTPKTLYNE